MVQNLILEAIKQIGILNKSEHPWSKAQCWQCGWNCNLKIMQGSILLGCCGSQRCGEVIQSRKVLCTDRICVHSKRKHPKAVSVICVMYETSSQGFAIEPKPSTISITLCVSCTFMPTLLVQSMKIGTYKPAVVNPVKHKSRYIYMCTQETTWHACQCWVILLAMQFLCMWMPLMLERSSACPTHVCMYVCLSKIHCKLRHTTHQQWCFTIFWPFCSHSKKQGDLRLNHFMCWRLTSPSHIGSSHVWGVKHHAQADWHTYTLRFKVEPWAAKTCGLQKSPGCIMIGGNAAQNNPKCPYLS